MNIFRTESGESDTTDFFLAWRSEKSVYRQDDLRLVGNAIKKLV